MKLTPVQGAIEFVRLLLGNQLNLPSNNEIIVEDLDPGQTILPLPSPPLTPYVPPTGGWFPLPPTNPGYNDRPLNPFFPPPAQPIDPNDQNQNGIPDDIDALLGGL